MNDRSIRWGLKSSISATFATAAFSLQTCDACKLTVFPPKEACPACLGTLAGLDAAVG